MTSLPLFSLETWILLVALICLFVAYGSWTYGVFEKMGIPGPKPVLYFGTLTKTNKVYYLADLECAAKYGRVWGFYELRNPVLSVMDPDMLKTILVKDCFTIFPNRRSLGLNGDLRDAMTLSEDDKWRRLRNIITPAYTTGHVKEMFQLMKYHSSKMARSLKSKAQSNEVITVKEIFGSYSMDVMGSCILSVDMDVTNSPSSELTHHASNLFKVSIPLFMFIGFFPFVTPLLDWLGMAFFSKDSYAFFKRIVEKIREDRKKSADDKKQADFLQYLMGVQSSNKLKGESYEQVLSDHELLCQLVMFVVGGYDTSASALTFLAYSLARNPDVMRRLQEEIDATFPNKGPVDYEALLQMEYLDCVFNENMRLYPSIPRTDRVAKETVTVNGITIPKNMIVSVPFFALHRDPELWPEPEEFRPERFSKENRDQIRPYSYMPFGTGPRNCVGMRFAQSMVKLALVAVLQHYSFQVCEETEIPLEFDPNGLLAPVRPIKLRICLRSAET